MRLDMLEVIGADRMTERETRLYLAARNLALHDWCADEREGAPHSCELNMLLDSLGAYQTPPWLPAGYLEREYD